VVDAAYDEMQRTLGTRAELRSVPGLPQPATFGVRRPVVLLPSALAWSEESTRRAVIAHELVHVRHRDWAWVVAEEMLRAALWFHPAIWWLVSRVQLTREEFTDHVAVLATGSRRAYIEALLAFADSDPVSPAPAFARRPHLFHRLVLLSKEAAMSARRVLVSGAVLGALLVAGGWYASAVFPVAAAQQRFAAGAPAPAPQAGGAAQRLNGVTPENPIPRRRFAPPAMYPLELAGSGFVAGVELQVVLDAGGGVASVNRGGVALSYAAPRSAAPTQDELSRAADAFIAAATESVMRWQYDPPATAPLTFWVALTFRPGAEALASQSDSPRGVSAGGGEVRIGGAARGARTGGAGAAGATAALRSGAGQLRSPSGAEPVRIGGAMKAPLQTRKVAPVYPDIARSARVQGVVILEALLDEQGRVADARVLRSIPLLDQAALDAVRQWEYTPVLLNGVPVPVLMTLTVQFTLDGASGTPQAGVGAPAPPPAASAPLRAASGAAPLRIGGAIRQPTQIRRVEPVYPPIAQSARVQGVVILEVLIDETGRVADARILRSIPLLDQAAIDAVRQWEYTPTLLNGVAMPVIMTVTVQFTLGG
jgi:protein TonB